MATVVLPEATRALYPFRSHYFTLSDGMRMHYIDEGPTDGEVLVFVHGYPTWSFVYRALVVYYAAQGYRCIALDHIGWGLSDKPGSHRYHTLRRHIHNALECLDALELHDVTLLMEDWGGPIGLGYALRRPDSVKRLVVMSSWVFQDSYPVPLHPLIQLATKPGVGDVLFRTLNLALNIGMQLWTERRLSAAVLDGYKAPFQDVWGRMALSQFPRMISTSATHRSASLMRRIEQELAVFDRKPSLILWGRSDAVFPPPMAKHWKTRMPSAKGPHLIEGANHFLSEDNPEAVMLRLDDFVART
jgi:cis-3-alkyl-4-acyloxetan-2-one decarboxylase